MEAKEKVVKETIAVRNLPEGTKAALAQLAAAHGRSFEAEARHAIKQYVAFNASASVAIQDEHNQRDLTTISALAVNKIEEAAYPRLLEMADVKESIFAVESAQAKRDSVSRKWCVGSAAVTSDDLRNREHALADSKAALLKLAEDRPLLKRHPIVSALAANN